MQLLEKPAPKPGNGDTFLEAFDWINCVKYVSITPVAPLFRVHVHSNYTRMGPFLITWINFNTSIDK